MTSSFYASNTNINVISTFKKHKLANICICIAANPPEYNLPHEVHLEMYLLSPKASFNSVFLPFQ